MAIIIEIAYEESSEAVERVRTMLAEAVLREPDWNGAVFKIERGDFTCVPGRDDAEAVILYRQIQRALRNEIE